VVEALAADAVETHGIKLLVAEVPGEDADGLRDLAQQLRNRFQNSEAAIVLGNAEGDRALLVAACTDRLVAAGVTAPKLLEQAAKAVGGGAGGKPILGFAGGKNASALGEALGAIPARLAELAGG
jgi:alanyl-tRNA synthetase